MLEEAPEPSDIQWDNLGLSKLELFKRGATSLFLQLLVLVVSFFIILGVYVG